MPLVLSTEEIPGGWRRVTIDTVTMGRAQVLVAPGEHPQSAIDAMFGIIEDRVSRHRDILHNGQ